jgi:hypothetical protein
MLVEVASEEFLEKINEDGSRVERDVAPRTNLSLLHNLRDASMGKPG